MKVTIEYDYPLDGKPVVKRHVKKVELSNYIYVDIDGTTFPSEPFNLTIEEEPLL